MMKMTFAIFWFVILLCLTPVAKAIEPLTSRELADLCDAYQQQPQSSNANQCVRYIKGFIDGAIAIDANIARRQRESGGLTSRATKTRATGRYNTTSNSEFCLGSPVPISHVVNNVVNWLQQHDIDNELAWVSVYQALKASYPCPD